MRIETLSHAGVGYSQMTPEELAEAGVPASLIALAAGVEIARAAEAEIDRLGDALAVSSSRAARYSQKLDEAKAYVAANRPANVAAGAYPMLVAEAEARAMTKSALADVIIARGTAYVGLMAMAEAQRAKVGPAVAAAETLADKQAAAEAVVAPFRAAVQAALAA